MLQILVWRPTSPLYSVNVALHNAAIPREVSNHEFNAVLSSRPFSHATTTISWSHLQYAVIPTEIHVLLYKLVVSVLEN